MKKIKSIELVKKSAKTLRPTAMSKLKGGGFTATDDLSKWRR